MKMTKKFLSVLLSCLMLLGMMSISVFAEEGTRENPINANGKWFGYGVDCYLLNPTIAEGDTDGVWYELTVEEAGILYLEHKYKDVDYTISLTTDNGLAYEGGCVDGVIYNGPIMTLPMQVGDVVTVQIVTKDAAAGTVYANMNMSAGTATDPIKVKSKGLNVYVGAGKTVYFQDDTLNADYATKGLLIDGSVDETTFYTVSVNSTSGAVVKKAVTDSDKDATIEATLGGSLGSAGAPPVKPMWAIENSSTMGIGTLYILTIVDSAHECVYDDDTDVDCNTCGAEREIQIPCSHDYDDGCDADCNTCGEVREAPHYTWPCMGYCAGCMASTPVTGDHVYAGPFAPNCDHCGHLREDALGITFFGGSISTDVNGLAMKFDATVEGMELVGTTAIYDNATIGGYKLIGMGAVVWNDGTDEYAVEDAVGGCVVNVPAVYLSDIDEAAGTVSFAVRIVNIPDAGKDTLIRFRSYFIYEDEEGVQHIVYGHSAVGAYNWF